MRYLPREMSKEIKRAATEYPVITLTGPRQSGKTTLIQLCFPNKPYLNLEAPDLRLMAQKDPRQLLNQYPDGVIFDEVQQVPELLSYIQVKVDETPEVKGKFVLTGSHQFSLNAAITQSLAGRTALLHLLPFSLSELAQDHPPLELHQQIFQGFYPRIYQDHLDPTRTYRQYLETYLERDVRQLIQLKDLKTFQHFLKLCAGRIGQLLNQNNLATELGVSSHTIKHWLSILEASYVIFRLNPYASNISKRLVKMPKLYFTDTGLASYLLDIENPNQLMRDPLRGQLFENMVVIEFVKHRLNQGLDPKLYFYRDSKGNEVDLIFKSGHQLTPIEIKISQTFHPDFFKGLHYFHKLFPTEARAGALLYGGELEQQIDEFSVLNYKNGLRVLEEQEKGA